MFFSFSKSRTAAVRAGEAVGKIAFAPDRSTTTPAPASAKRSAAMRATRGSRIDSPHARQTSAGIGVPHVRCRERHHSGCVLDHLPLARAPPLRRVLDGVGRVERALAQHVLIHRDEPLRRRAEDHRIVTAPAVRIGVLVLRRAPQRAARAQVVDDPRVGGENVHARRTARPRR